MAATIEEAKANDPVLLRKEIALLKKNAAPREQDANKITDLERLLAEERAKVKPAGKTEIKEKKIVIAGDLTRLEKLYDKFEALDAQLSNRTLDYTLASGELKKAIAEAKEINAQQLSDPSNYQIFEAGFGRHTQPGAVARAHPSAPVVNVGRVREATGAARSMASSNGDVPKVGKGEMATLRAIVQHGSVSRTQLTILTGYKRSTRDAYIQRLSGWSLIGPSHTPGEFSPTEAGIETAGEVDMPPTGRELIDWWAARLPGGEREVFAFVVSHNGDEVSREQIGESTGYARSSRDAYLQRLTARKLIEPSGRGAVKPAAMLF